jgi:hypothetical protein
VSFKVGGNVDDPSFSIVKVGQSTAAPASSGAESPKQPQNIQEAVKDKVMDRLGIPTKPKEEAPVSPGATESASSAPTQPQETPPDTKQPQKDTREAIKEEAGKALRNLIKRK